MICSYVSGQKGLTDHDVSPDPPNEGAIEWLLEISRDYTVYVLSGHFARPETRLKIMRSSKEWLMRYGVPREKISIEPNLSGPIVVSATKPKCLLTIDDRAFCYRGGLPDRDFLRSFQPFRAESRLTSSKNG